MLESPSSQAKHEGLRTWELGDWTSSTRRGKTYRKHINCRGSCQELPSGGCLGPHLMLSLSKCSPCLPSWTRLFMQTTGSQKGLGWKERYRSSKSTSPHHGQEQFFWCGDVYVVAVSSDQPLLLHFSPRSQALGPTAAPWASPAPPAIPATQTRPSLSGQDDVLT